MDEVIHQGFALFLCALYSLSLFFLPSVVCPMLCKNGGVCVQKDQCLCPPNFTGKFCHIPVSTAASTNEIEKQATSAVDSANQPMTSEYILPLQTPELINTNGERICVFH